MKDSSPLLPAHEMQFVLAGRTFRISRFFFLLIMGALVGALTGGVTVCFRLAAIKGEQLFFPAYHHAGLPEIWSLDALERMLMPAVGGLICGLILFRFGKFEGSHHIPAILRAVASGHIYFKLRMAVPSLLSIVTLASGGSVGPEGPIAEIGSVTGSQIGRLVKIPPKMVKPLIGAGVAGGIAAVFNAPIGGLFFAIEVILRDYEIASFTPIAVSAVVASVIAQFFLGDRMAIAFPARLDISAHDLPFFALLGVVCGFLSILYIRGLGACHDQFHRIRIPMWLKPAIGGLCVGLIGLVFPNVMGEGYDWIRQVMRPETINPSEGWLRGAFLQVGGHWLAPVCFLLVLMFLKILATSLSLGSGNPGGSFAPAIFIGVMGGAAFGMLLKELRWVPSQDAFAVMGMAGLIAGALGAPITAIMITLRHGGNAPELLLPVMTTVALTVFVMQFSRNMSVYTLEFLRMGIDLDHARESDPLSLVRVQSVLHTSGFEELPGDIPVCEALERVKEGLARWFVVRGDGGQFAGIVSLHEMRMTISESELSHLLVQTDITDAFTPRLTPEMSLKDALAYFGASEAEVLPVFDSKARDAAFLGVISRQDALNAYWQFTQAI
ncbi:MAG: chloride channel protein [bacterium]|nr:chloride channel protein [bacterium]